MYIWKENLIKRNSISNYGNICVNMIVFFMPKSVIQNSLIVAHCNETRIKFICVMKISWFFCACINGFNLSFLFYLKRSRCIDKSFIIKEITLLPSLYEIGIQFLIVSGWYMSLCKHIQCNISPEMISYKDIFNRILLILHLQTQWKGWFMDIARYITQ